MLKNLVEWFDSRGFLLGKSGSMLGLSIIGER